MSCTRPCQLPPNPSSKLVAKVTVTFGSLQINDGVSSFKGRSLHVPAPRTPSGPQSSQAGLGLFTDRPTGPRSTGAPIQHLVRPPMLLEAGAAAGGGATPSWVKGLETAPKLDLSEQQTWFWFLRGTCWTPSCPPRSSGPPPSGSGCSRLQAEDHLWRTPTKSSRPLRSSTRTHRMHMMTPYWLSNNFIDDSEPIVRCPAAHLDSDTRMMGWI